MWINLSREEAHRVGAALYLLSQHVPEAAGLADRIAADMADRLSAENLPYVQAAQRLHERDGELEIDQQADGSALVSISEDAGAYVMAWAWVPDDELPA